jgi:hypothetical protein
MSSFGQIPVLPKRELRDLEHETGRSRSSMTNSSMVSNETIVLPRSREASRPVCRGSGAMWPGSGTDGSGSGTDGSGSGTVPLSRFRFVGCDSEFQVPCAILQLRAFRSSWHWSKERKPSPSILLSGFNSTAGAEGALPSDLEEEDEDAVRHRKGALPLRSLRIVPLCSLRIVPLCSLRIVQEFCNPQVGFDSGAGPPTAGLFCNR